MNAPPKILYRVMFEKHAAEALELGLPAETTLFSYIPPIKDWLTNSVGVSIQVPDSTYVKLFGKEVGEISLWWTQKLIPPKYLTTFSKESVQ